eukprot:503816-Prorocentrum_lima.AAC.1
MTSSLVGSEMCIRDRPRARRDHRGCTGRKGQGGGQLLRPRHSSGSRQVPVSYTHLTLPTICSV